MQLTLILLFVEKNTTHSEYYAEYYGNSLDKLQGLQHNPEVDEQKEKMANGELDGKPPLEETGMSLSPDGIPLGGGVNLPPNRHPLDDEIEVTKFGTTAAPPKKDKK